VKLLVHSIVVEEPLYSTIIYNQNFERMISKAFTQSNHLCGFWFLPSKWNKKLRPMYILYFILARAISFDVIFSCLKVVAQNNHKKWLLHNQEIGLGMSLIVSWWGASTFPIHAKEQCQTWVVYDFTTVTTMLCSSYLFLHLCIILSPVVPNTLNF